MAQNPNPTPGNDPNVRGVGTHIEGGGKKARSMEGGEGGVDVQKLKAMGYPEEVASQLSPDEMYAIDVSKLDFGKILQLVTGLLDLFGKVFGGGVMQPADVQKAPVEEVKALKAQGVPDPHAAFGWTHLVGLIRVILSLVKGGGGGLIGAAPPGPTSGRSK